jgi:hypothetical protein
VECSDEGLIHELLCVPGHGRFRFVAVRPYDRIGGKREIQKIIYIKKEHRNESWKDKKKFRRDQGTPASLKKRRFAQLVDGCAPRCGAVQVERVERRGKNPRRGLTICGSVVCVLCCLSQK